MPWELERILVSRSEFPCQVFLPEGSPPPAGWPVVLSLHGAGERGHDGELPSSAGLGVVLRLHPEWLPAVVIFPQAPEQSWWKGPAAEAAWATLALVARRIPTNPDRLYLIGLSMGGFGVWDLALQHPEEVAALVSVCGGLIAPPQFPGMSTMIEGPDPYSEAARRLPRLPVRLFHGDQDPIIPVTESRLLHAAWQQAGHPVRYDEFPGTGHNSWDPAFHDPTLWEWLFAQNRAARARKGTSS